MKFVKFLFCIVLISLAFSACGSDGGPFEMATMSTAVVGNPDANVHFIADPEDASGSGTLTAQIDEEFFDRRTLIITDFSLTLNYDSIGPVNYYLNPNLESTAVVYKLNANNQVFGTHTMNLNLILETPDQNLTLDNVMLASDTATLTLAQPLPILTFQFNGENKQIQILSLTAVIPAELITSNEDPLHTF